MKQAENPHKRKNLLKYETQMKTMFKSIKQNTISFLLCRKTTYVQMNMVMIVTQTSNYQMLTTCHKSEVKVAQLYLFVTPWTIYSPWNSPAQNTGVGKPFPSPGDLPNAGIKPRSPTLQADSLPSEPPGKPKNTGVGGLSLLQQIFLTQESNQGLLHCRQILYHLRYQGSPKSQS